MTSRTTFLVRRSSFLLLLAVAAVLLPGCGSRPKQGPNHPASGQPLMFLDLEPLTGTAAPITRESLTGRVTLMNFWATWCGPCKLEFPKIAAAAKKLSTDPKFQYLSVNLDNEGKDRLPDVEKFLREQHADHPTWSDATGATSDGLAHLFWKGNIPMTLVIDGTGTIRGIWIGYEPGFEVEMETLVRELLSAGKGPA